MSITQISSSKNDTFYCFWFSNLILVYFEIKKLILKHQIFESFIIFHTKNGKLALESEVKDKQWKGFQWGCCHWWKLRVKSQSSSAYGN